MWSCDRVVDSVYTSLFVVSDYRVRAPLGGSWASAMPNSARARPGEQGCLSVAMTVNPLKSKSILLSLYTFFNLAFTGSCKYQNTQVDNYKTFLSNVI